MEDEPLDFRSLVIHVARHLTKSDVDHIACWFNVRGTFKDGVQLLNTLEKEGMIDAENVTKLIASLKEINNTTLAKKVQQYQTEADKNPSARDLSVFAGRSGELDEINFHIQDEETTNSRFRAVFITGMPGVGKTFLVREYMRLHSTEPNSKKHFISCRGVKSVVDLIDLLKEELSLQFSSKRANYKAIATNLKCSTEKRLIVFDNIEEVMEHQMEKFVEFLTNFVTHVKAVKMRRHCLLITSRRRLPEDVVMRLTPELLHVKLDEMTMKDSKTLLGKYLGGRHVEEKELERLATLCGRHPLSMALVANRMRLYREKTVETIESEMKKQPLSTLRNIEEMRDLKTLSCIEGTFEQVFNSLKQSEQQLLICLATAAHDMSKSVALEIFGRPEDRTEFDSALDQLQAFNLINRRVETDKKRREKESPRYSMHLLTRNFVLQYCQLDDCPTDLKEKFIMFKRRLLDENVRNMKLLSSEELVNPERFAEGMKRERLNYLPILGEIYDLLIEEKSSYDDFCRVDDVIFNIIHNPREHTIFLSQRLKFVRKLPDSVHVQKFIKLRLADMIRQCGSVDKSKQKFERLRQQLFDEDIGLKEEHKKQLQIFYFRYFGRCLKVNSGNLIKNLKKSVDHLEKAIEGFNDTSLFADRERQTKELAETYSDLGNTLVLLSEQSDTNKVAYLRKAKKNFEMTKEIFLKSDKATSRLFDINLSLGTCDMELISWQLSSVEDVTAFSHTLKYYEDAEEIAKQNGAIIVEDPNRMGNLYYGRGVCRYRANEFEGAACDAQKALKMREQVFGTHNKTMSCHILLGNIYRRLHIQRHQQRSLENYCKALDMAVKLKRRNKEVNKSDLDHLEIGLEDICKCMKADYEEYGGKIEAIRHNKPIDDDSDVSSNSSNSDVSSICESDESGKTDDSTGARSTNTFDDDSSDPDDERSSAPSPTEAEELSKKLKDLMERQAVRINTCPGFDVTHMKTLVHNLMKGYRKMDDEKRNAYFVEGIKLFHEIRRLETEPATFLKERAMRMPKTTSTQAARVRSPQYAVNADQLRVPTSLLELCCSSNSVMMLVGAFVIVCAIICALILKHFLR